MPGLPPPGAGPSRPGLPPGPGSGPSPFFGPAPGARGSATQANVAYGSESEQRLDLYWPSGSAAGPLLLFVHGGGWSGGDKAEFAWLGQQLANEGVVVALVNYRLSPKVKHPAHAEDVAQAVAWLYRHAAEYGGDPERLYLAGHSAGAHLASLVALDPRYLAAQGLDTGIVRGVAGIAGAAYDLDARYAATPMASLLVPAFGSDVAEWPKAAPLRYVKPGAPPFLLVHGLNDTSAPAAGAQAFATALRRDGVPTELRLLPGMDHMSVLAGSAAALADWLGGSAKPSGGAGRPS